jgi:hypothetical protein
MIFLESVIDCPAMDVGGKSRRVVASGASGRFPALAL